MSALLRQPSLFGRTAPRCDPHFTTLYRTDLGSGAWIAHQPGWIRGHDALFDHLYSTTQWRAERRRMYDRMVDVPRLTARLPTDGPGHPLLPELAATLSQHFAWPLTSLSMALYRDGQDSVAMHGDRMGPLRANCVVAIVSLGAPRRFLLRPVAGGRARSWQLGFGDLFVMGGTCQQTWEHGVPKGKAAGARISLMFRPHRD